MQSAPTSGSQWLVWPDWVMSLAHHSQKARQAQFTVSLEWQLPGSEGTGLKVLRLRTNQHPAAQQGWVQALMEGPAML